MMFWTALLYFSAGIICGTALAYAIVRRQSAAIQAHRTAQQELQRLQLEQENYLQKVRAHLQNLSELSHTCQEHVHALHSELQHTALDLTLDAPVSSVPEHAHFTRRVPEIVHPPRDYVLEKKTHEQ